MGWTHRSWLLLDLKIAVHNLILLIVSLSNHEGLIVIQRIVQNAVGSCARVLSHLYDRIATLQLIDSQLFIACRSSLVSEGSCWIDLTIDVWVLIAVLNGASCHELVKLNKLWSCGHVGAV